MGIQGLTKLIADNAPAAIKEREINSYFSRKICVDASMALYSFLIAVRPDDTGSFTLTNDIGETTSHLVGMFYRTIRMLDNGIKPCFVFDGKPPVLKSGELAKRKKRQKEAEEAKLEAKEEGDAETLAKMNKRTVRVTKDHNEDAKKLLRLMGVPVVEAPCEAEAQCCALVSAGKCYGVASEDMDSLTLGAPILLRHMTYSEARKVPIREIHLDKVLEDLDLSMDSFIDLCILLGCDYCDTIRGVGPKRALEGIKKYKTIEKFIEHLDTEKYPVPENFPIADIRELFKHPEVTDPETLDLKWTEPDEEGLLQYLVQEKGFSEDRVRKGIEKLKKNAKQSIQGRITSFFNAPPSPKKTVKKEENKRESKPFFPDPSPPSSQSQSQPSETKKEEVAAPPIPDDPQPAKLHPFFGGFVKGKQTAAVKPEPAPTASPKKKQTAKKAKSEPIDDDEIEDDDIESSEDEDFNPKKKHKKATEMENDPVDDPDPSPVGPSSPKKRARVIEEDDDDDETDAKRSKKVT